MENIKLIQLEKYHKAQNDFERDRIEIDPKKIFHQAIENCKPLLVLQRVKRGGVTYQVIIFTLCAVNILISFRWLSLSEWQSVGIDIREY